MIRPFLLAAIFLLAASTTAVGEYYQYTDSNGDARFTDNLQEVPQDQRPDIKVFESVEPSSELESEPAMDQGEEQSDAPEAPDAVETKSADEEPAELAADISTANELNRLQNELTQTRIALEQEKSDIEADAPDDNALSQEKIAYSMQVEALNAKIKEYENNLKAFEDKVEAFNKQKNKKQ